MTQDSRKKLLTLGLLVICLTIIAVPRLALSPDLAALATIVLVGAMLLLMKQAAKWQLFQLSPSFPIPIPQVKGEWDIRAIVIGILCFPAALLWGVCVGLGIRFHVWDNVSSTVAWLIISPGGVLILTGLFLMARGIFVGPRK